MNTPFINARLQEPDFPPEAKAALSADLACVASVCPDKTDAALAAFWGKSEAFCDTRVRFAA